MLIIYAGAKLYRINRWNLDRWNITFEVPRYLMIELNTFSGIKR